MANNRNYVNLLIMILTCDVSPASFTLAVVGSHLQNRPVPEIPTFYIKFLVFTKQHKNSVVPVMCW